MTFGQGAMRPRNGKTERCQDLFPEAINLLPELLLSGLAYTGPEICCEIDIVGCQVGLGKRRTSRMASLPGCFFPRT